jgi:hypothetical protein
VSISSYRDEIVRAVLGEGAIGVRVANRERLGQLAGALAQAETAKQLLCAKGYGCPELSIDEIVRQIPATSG